MNISPIAFNTTQYKKPEFTGYYSKFSKTLDTAILPNSKVTKEDARNLIDMVCEFIKNRLKPTNILGEGHFGKVYRIDDKYVLKENIAEPRLNLDFTPVKKPKFNDLKTYYGEPVAYFSNIKILKNVSSNSKHTPVGIPINMHRIALPEDLLGYYENYLLPKTAELPQKAFDAIAKDMDTLNKKGRGLRNYTFDYLNPNNFVIVGKSIRITDEIAETLPPKPNTAANLLNVFIENTSLNDKAEYSILAEGNRRTLLKKIVLAAMKSNLALGDKGRNLETWDYVLIDLCDLKVDPKEFLGTLKSISANAPTAKNRVERANKYLDNVFSEPE